MNELDLYTVESSEDNPFSNMFGGTSERVQMIADHKHFHCHSGRKRESEIRTCRAEYEHRIHNQCNGGIRHG